MDFATQWESFLTPRDLEHLRQTGHKTQPFGFGTRPALLVIDTIITCGETASGCVRATVVDGATYRLNMGVVGDCCFDRTEASHWINRRTPSRDATRSGLPKHTSMTINARCSIPARNRAGSAHSAEGGA